MDEVAALLKLNPQTIRNTIDRGDLPAVRFGARRVRVRRVDWARYATGAVVAHLVTDSPLAGEQRRLRTLEATRIQPERLTDERVQPRRSSLRAGTRRAAATNARTHQITVVERVEFSEFLTHRLRRGQVGSGVWNGQPVPIAWKCQRN